MTRTAAEVEREVEESRANLDRTVEALKDKMTPGQLFDEATRTMGGAGSQVLSKLVDQAKENPMPLAVMGLGLAWLMSTNNKPASHGGTAPYPTSYEPRSFAPSDGAGDGASSGGGLSDALHAVGDKAHDMVSAGREKMAHGAHAVGDMGHSAAHRLSDAKSAVGERASEYKHKAKDGFDHLIEREPLVIGAIGLAVGAAIGAALPSTAVEDKVLGQARDKIVEKGKDLTHEGLTTARGIAEAAYDGAKAELQPEGDEPPPMADRVGAAITAAVHAGQDKLQEARADHQPEAEERPAPQA